MEVGRWVQVHTGKKLGKSSQNSLILVLIFWISIPCVLSYIQCTSCTSLKVVIHCDLSVLSMYVRV